MPYPNEHACRLESPDKYDSIRRENCAERDDGRCIDVLYGILDGESERQALRYPKDTWNESDARAHCRDEGGTFEPAREERDQMNRRWYEINAQDENVEVMIFDEIGLWGIRAEDFRREFDRSVANASSINVVVNSPGGDVFDGVAMYNTIARYRERTTVEVAGVAASIASIIALAGDRMVMDTGTFFMIHNPWAFALGTAGDLRQRADTLDAVRDEMIGIYQERSNLDRDAILEAMEAETWYNPDQAYQAGFAQEITTREDEQIAARSFDWRTYGYRRVPQPLWEARRRNVVPKTERDLEESLVALGYSKRQAERIVSDGYRSLQGEPAEDEAQGDPAAIREIGDALQSQLEVFYG